MAKLKKKCDERLERWFEEAMERIKKATGARTQVQLAEVLEVRQSSISDAKRRCSVPSDWFLKLYRSHGLNPNWLSDGQEPVYLNANRGGVSAENLLRETPASYGRTNARGRVVPVSSMLRRPRGLGPLDPRLTKPGAQRRGWRGLCRGRQ